MTEGNPEKNFSWKLVYTVRDSKKGGYALYENNTRVKNIDADLANADKGVILYYSGEKKFVVDLQTLSGSIKKGKDSVVWNMKQYLRTVDDVFKKDAELSQKVAEKFADDVSGLYQKDTHSFVPKKIKEECGFES